MSRQRRIHREPGLLIRPVSLGKTTYGALFKHTLSNVHVLHENCLSCFCVLCITNMFLCLNWERGLPAACTVIHSEAVEEETTGHKHTARYAHQSVWLTLIGCTDISLQILESSPYTCFSPTRTRTKVTEAICQLNAFTAFSYRMSYFTAHWVSCSLRPVTAGANTRF